MLRSITPCAAGLYFVMSLMYRLWSWFSPFDGTVSCTHNPRTVQFPSGATLLFTLSFTMRPATERAPQSSAFSNTHPVPPYRRTIASHDSLWAPHVTFNPLIVQYDGAPSHNRPCTTGRSPAAARTVMRDVAVPAVGCSDTR